MSAVAGADGHVGSYCVAGAAADNQGRGNGFAGNREAAPVVVAVEDDRAVTGVEDFAGTHGFDARRNRAKRSVCLSGRHLVGTAFDRTEKEEPAPAGEAECGFVRIALLVSSNLGQKVALMPIQ
ncbi:hypothetical protein BDB13_5906 [Rhodococcus sp. OK302]|nr:hypothetical protein BDB13_5906 [Rhodococcus sp. OK302]